VLCRRVFGTLTLLGALLAPAGVARAQSSPLPAPNVPAPTPPGLDAVARPLSPSAPEHPVVVRKVIASSQSNSTMVGGVVPVPDDALPGESTAVQPGRDTPAPSAYVRTAVYRPDLDKGAVELVNAPVNRATVSAATRAAPAARLDLHMDGEQKIGPGRQFVYTIYVQSTGTAPAMSARVIDHLPPGIRLLNAEPKPEIAGDRLTWDLGDMPPGTERRIGVSIDADKLSTEFVVRPVASFSVDAGLRIAPAHPVLELSLLGPATAPPGATVPYRVQIANNGSTALQRVILLVKLSAGLRHSSQGRSDAIEADVTLAPGETKTLPLDLLAGPAGSNSIVASARVDNGPSAEVRSVVLIDAAAPALSVGVRPVTHLRADISNLTEAVTVGAPVVYEIRLTNPDGASQTGIRLLAELTEGLEPEQADGPTAFASNGRGIVFETLRRLGPGEAAIYHVRARAKRAGVQQLRVEVNADRQSQPTTAESSTWVAPGHGR